MAAVVKNRIFRHGITRLPYQIFITDAYSSAIRQTRNFSSSSMNNNDDDHGKKSSPEDARKKLLKLLTEVRSTRTVNAARTEENTDPTKESKHKKLKLAKPRLKKMDIADHSENVTGLDPEIVHAVHRVATTVASVEKEGKGGNIDDEDRREINVRKTESALLKKLKSVADETEEGKLQSNTKDLTSLFGSLKVQPTGE